MKTKTIVIIVSAFSVVLVLFFTLILCLNMIRRERVANWIESKMNTPLPSEGIIFRYSENLYPSEYALQADNDFSYNDSDDNIQVTVYADGRMVVKRIYDPKLSSFGISDPYVYETHLSEERLQELKDRIASSGVWVVWDVKGYYYNYENEPFVAIPDNDENCAIVNEYMCNEITGDMEPAANSCREFIKYAAGFLTEDEMAEFDRVISEGEKDNRPVYSFNEPPNDYLRTGDYEGVDMFRYYEELFNVDDPVSQGFQTCVGINGDGKITLTGSYSIYDTDGSIRFNDYKQRLKEKLTREELQYLQELVEECDFCEYCTETEIGYEPPAMQVKEDFQTVCFLTVSCNGTKFYAIDDGSNPKLRKLIDEYLRLTTDGIKAEDAYSTSREKWEYER